jgi:hypothetical protein
MIHNVLLWHFTISSRSNWHCTNECYRSILCLTLNGNFRAHNRLDIKIVANRMSYRLMWASPDRSYVLTVGRLHVSRILSSHWLVIRVKITPWRNRAWRPTPDRSSAWSTKASLDGDLGWSITLAEVWCIRWSVLTNIFWIGGDKIICC